MSNLSPASPSSETRQAPDFWYIVAEYPHHPDRQQSLAGPFIGFTEAERNYPAVLSLYHLILGHSAPVPDFNYYRGETPHHDPRMPPQWINPLIGLNAFGRPLLPDQPDVLEAIHHHLQAEGPAPVTPDWLAPWSTAMPPESYHHAMQTVHDTLRAFEHPETFWSTCLAVEQGAWHPFIDYALAIGLPIAPQRLQEIFQARIRLRLTPTHP